MVFGWLFGKNKLEQHKKEVHEHIKGIKNELGKAASWINHLHSKGENHDSALGEMNDRINSVENDLEQIKTFISFFNTHTIKQLSKQPQTDVYKQTAVGGVQTPVQTGVQSAFLRNLTASERIVVWVLLNTEMKLSCDDIAVLLNKDKSTIRGQLNNIKSKSEGLVNEIAEPNTGKKRFFVEPEVKDMLLKKMSPQSRKKTIKKVKSEAYSE